MRTTKSDRNDDSGLDENNFILIKRKTIALGSTVIQISHISSVSIFKLSQEYYSKKENILRFYSINVAIKIFIIVFIFGVLFYSGGRESSPTLEELLFKSVKVSFWIYVVWVLYGYFIWVIYSVGVGVGLLKIKRESVLVIESNSGSKNLIFSKDVDLLNKMFLSVQDCIESPRDEPIYFDFRQDKTIRIEGGVRGSVNSGEVSL